MRKIIILLSLLSFNFVLSQNSILLMDYDEGGNQIKRHYLVVLRIKNPNKDEIKKFDTIQYEVSEYSDIQFYPNPITENLYLKWENNNDVVKIISLYNLNGQKIKSFEISDLNTFQINFEGLPSGYYNLIFDYESGRKKNLNLIKK